MFFELLTNGTPALPSAIAQYAEIGSRERRGKAFAAYFIRRWDRLGLSAPTNISLSKLFIHGTVQIIFIQYLSLTNLPTLQQANVNTDGLPTEVILAILIAGVHDPEYGKQFGARCMRLASWIQPYIAPALYHTVDLWTEVQARSFLDTIEKNTSQWRRLVSSLDIETTAFSAENDEVGRFTPLGTTSATVLNILAILCENECPLRELHIPMVILATRRNPSEQRLRLPRSMTLTGVDGIAWTVYDWRTVTHLRFTCYNPTFMEIRWMANLPSLTHFAFAFYYELPLGLRIIETMTLPAQMKCVVPVIFPGSGGGRARVAATKKELKKLDDPKLVIWGDTPSALAIFNDIHANTFWKMAEERAEAQKLEKRMALGEMIHTSYENAGLFPAAADDMVTITVL